MYSECAINTTVVAIEWPADALKDGKEKTSPLYHFHENVRFLIDQQVLLR